LRVITDDEATAWARCQKAAREGRSWQEFLQTYPKSHLARLAKERLINTENRLSREAGLSNQDSEEIALWNRCL
jgi:DNA polymerase III gamma/tau subunit